MPYKTVPPKMLQVVTSQHGMPITKHPWFNLKKYTCERAQNEDLIGVRRSLPVADF